MSDPLQEDELAQALEQMLVPVRPTSAFRDHLRANLELASHQHESRRRYRRRQMRWENWWVAVVLFIASIAAGSALAYVLRTRLLSA